MKAYKYSFQSKIITLLMFLQLSMGCENDIKESKVNEVSNELSSVNLVAGSIGFIQAGPVGGGFPNVVTWDPNVPGKVYYGADIGGTGRSLDYGKTFEAAAKGLGFRESHGKIAVLNAVDINGQTLVVGGTGFKGTPGGVVISSDSGGDLWTEDSEDISFSAQNSNAPLPTGRPRSTDPSLIQYVGGITWIAGTYDKGVWISSDDRNSWSRLNVFSGSVFIRSMAMSPDDANTVYVGLWGDESSINNKGLWKISNLNGTPMASKVSNIPDVVESITVLGNRMYLACGRFGVRRYVPSNGNLSDITSVIGTTVMSTAIHGVKRTWNTDRIVVGTAEGNGDIWLSEDSGDSWTNTTATGVSNVPWGGNGELLVFESHPTWSLGKSKCDVASIQVSPHDPDAWVVCSTSSIWTTEDAGQNWYPANGFQILTYRDVEINAQGLIAAGNVDHDVLVSNDGGTVWDPIGLNGVTVGHALAFSPDDTKLAFGDNERDNNDEAAKLGVSDSPSTVSAPYEITTYPSAPKRITGMTWVKFPGGTERLITAIDDGGVQTVDYHPNNNNWSNWVPRVSSATFMGAQSNRGLRTSVVSNDSNIVFVYDRKTGVWRSTNYGVDWMQISNISAEEDQGYLAYDGSNDCLYIATPTEVLRVDNASTSSVTTNLNFPRPNPGAIALDPFGRLLVFAKPTGPSGSDSVSYLYRNENPETGQNNWIDIADENLKRVAPQVIDLDATANFIVLVTAGKGMLISSNDVQ